MQTLARGLIVSIYVIYWTFPNLLFQYMITVRVHDAYFRKVREGKGSIPGVGAKRRREDGEAV